MADVIGRMDRRITIEQPAETRDGSGSVATDWIAIADDIHAQVTRGSGREYLSGATMQDGGEIVFRIRWRAGITPKCRVLYGGAYYSVIGEPVEIGRQNRLDIKASRVVQEAQA